MREEKLYLETLKEIKEMKKYVKAEIDNLYDDLQNLRDIRKMITELQEEVAKIAGEPVSMLFANYRA